MERKGVLYYIIIYIRREKSKVKNSIYTCFFPVVSGTSSLQTRQFRVSEQGWKIQNILASKGKYFKWWNYVYGFKLFIYNTHICFYQYSSLFVVLRLYLQIYKLLFISLFFYISSYSSTISISTTIPFPWEQSILNILCSLVGIKALRHAVRATE